MAMQHPSWLTDALKDDIKSSGSFIKLEKGHVFIKEHMPDLYSYLLLKGRVRIVAKADPYSHDLHADMILNDIEAIDVIGEISAIDKEPHSSLAETVTDCELFRLRAGDFRALIDEHKPLRDHVMLRLCQKIRNANDRLRDNCVLSAQLRVTREIIRLAEDRQTYLMEHHHDAGYVMLEMPKHHILASRCGVTRETVSRVIGKLIKDGVVLKADNGIIIEDIDKLAAAMSKNS